MVDDVDEGAVVGEAGGEVGCVPEDEVEVQLLGEDVGVQLLGDEVGVKLLEDKVGVQLLEDEVDMQLLGGAVILTADDAVSMTAFSVVLSSFDGF